MNVHSWRYVNRAENPLTHNTSQLKLKLYHTELFEGVEMHDKLAEVELKTGEVMAVGVVTTPDEAHAEKLKRFLGHKRGKWQ